MGQNVISLRSQSRARDVAQLIDCSLSTCEALGSVLALCKPVTVVYICDRSTSLAT